MPDEEFDTSGISESEVANLIAWAADEAKAAIQELIALTMDSLIESDKKIKLSESEKNTISEIITGYNFKEPPTVDDVKDCCKKCVEEYIKIAKKEERMTDGPIDKKSLGDRLKEYATKQQKAKETLESAEEKGSVFSRITTVIIDTGKSVATYAHDNPGKFMLIAGSLVAGGAAGVGIGATIAAGMSVEAGAVLGATTAGTGSLLSAGAAAGSAAGGVGTTGGLLKIGSIVRRYVRRYRAKKNLSNNILKLAKRYVKQNRSKKGGVANQKGGKNTGK